MMWYFSQSQSTSCSRWQKTQPVLSVCFIPKEAATFPETYGPSGNAFESLRKIPIHPAQVPICWSYCGGATHSHSHSSHLHGATAAVLNASWQNKQMCPSFPRTHLAELAFPRISDMDSLFLKPSSCLFCHSDQTQWVGIKERVSVGMLVWCFCKKYQDVQSINWLSCGTWIFSLQEHRDHPTIIAKWFQLWAVSTKINEGEGSWATSALLSTHGIHSGTRGC